MHLSPHTFADLRTVIHQLCGLVLTEEKGYLIQHRLEPVALENGCTSFEALVRKLRGPEAAALNDAIVEAITTKETAFFRDRHPFTAFRQLILPSLGEARRERNPRQPAAPVRFWSAGTSTGQEAYSLAILICEYVAANPMLSFQEDDFRILATDVSSCILETARSGVYSERDVARGLTPGQVVRFFDRQEDQWVVKEQLRRLIDFRRVNLMQSFASLGTFDAILCRNVLIYFDEPARQRICARFHDMLAPGGFLVLGAAENLYGLTERFESIHHGATLLYRRPIEER